MTQRAEWAQRRFGSFDTETTGVQVESDRLVTSTLLEIHPLRFGVMPVQHEWLINPGVEIPAGASAVHGVTTEKARAEGRKPSDALTEIRDRLYDIWNAGDALVIYNAPYDLTLLDRDLRRNGLEPLGEIGPVIDPLVIDKEIFPRLSGKGRRKLINACPRYNVTLEEKDAHSSVGDSLAAGRIAYQQASHELISGLAVLDLHQRQKLWFESQQLSFAKWLRSRDSDGAEEMQRNAAYGWPMLPFERRLASAESGGEAPF